jgi:hypothetical protein
MPSATPLPRGPSVLTLYSAADLLTAPGCPVCRYASEAADRYLGWFALEGHAQPGMITSLCGSLGMCARHTRRLMSQPGAAVRLTAVYRYVLTAARDRIAGGTPATDPCPACRHDDAAADRALDTLIEGLASGEALDRCRDLGGVCIPHLAAAARSAPPRVTGWLADVTRGTLECGQTRIGWLAGIDRDAEARARLRQALPGPGAAVPGACAACVAGARAERDGLARLPGLADSAEDADPGLVVCGLHLADAALAAALAGRERPLLAWQAACLASGPRRAAWRAGLRSLAHRARHPGCMICDCGADAAQRALVSIASAPAPPRRLHTLCVRHHFVLRKLDRRAARLLGPGLAGDADVLTGELTDAFDQTTWARRRGGPVQQSAVWQQAAAFLDGAVFGGCPPPRAPPGHRGAFGTGGPRPWHR